MLKKRLMFVWKHLTSHLHLSELIINVSVSMNEQCSGSHLRPPQLILMTRESDINLQEISRGNKGINKWEEDIKICTKNAFLIRTVTTATFKQTWSLLKFCLHAKQFPRR